MFNLDIKLRITVLSNQPGREETSVVPTLNIGVTVYVRYFLLVSHVSNKFARAIVLFGDTRFLSESIPDVL